MSSPEKPSAAQIREMFDGLAARYDLFNRLTSLGQDISWRRIALADLPSASRVLDLGCGTGDLACLAAQRVGPAGEVVGIDFSQEMLSIASGRAAHLPPGSAVVRYVHKRAEEVPFESPPYDWVVSGFVLRNIYENIDPILAGVWRSLKPGGQIRLLDFTEPSNSVIRFLWKLYMRSAVAVFGRCLFGRKYPSHYMTESARRFVKPPEFVKKLEVAGFKNVQVRFFMLGTIVLYRAVK